MNISNLFFALIISIVSYVRGTIIESQNDIIFGTKNNHYQPSSLTNDAELYEDKILRARAYVNDLSNFESSSLSSSSLKASSYGSPSSSSSKMYGPIEPFDHRDGDQHRFEWMHPFEFYECNSNNIDNDFDINK